VCKMRGYETIIFHSSLFPSFFLLSFQNDFLLFSLLASLPFQRELSLLNSKSETESESGAPQIYSTTFLIKERTRLLSYFYFLVCWGVRNTVGEKLFVFMKL